MNITYSGLKLDNNSQKLIRKITKHFQITNVIPRDRLHCTMFYSRDYIKDYVPKGKVEYKAKFDKFSIFDTEDGRRVLVIELLGDDLISRNKELTDQFNIKSDFESYRPHITISFRYENDRIPNIEDLDVDVDLDINTHTFTFIEEYSCIKIPKL